MLATTRRPQGEDATDVPAGATALLHSGDVDWGETVDSRLLYTASDGSGTSYADELDDWTMTRPSHADCDAIAAPAAGSGSTAPTSASATPGATTAPVPPSGTTAPGGSGTPTSSAPTSAGGPVPAPGSPSGGSQSGPSAVVSSGAAGSDGASGRAVGAGRPITVQGSGFSPGEDVVLRLRGSGAVLAQGTAGPDGSVLLALTVPAGASGSTQLDLVGRTSQTTAPLRLEVAALSSGVDDGRPPFSSRRWPRCSRCWSPGAAWSPCRDAPWRSGRPPAGTP